MMIGRRTLAVAVLAAAAVASAAAPNAARAEFEVCNRTFDVVNLAVSQTEGAASVTRGWWTLGPSQCVTVIEGSLRTRFVQVLAIDVQGRPMLEGRDEKCVDDARFEARGDGDCLRRGLIPAPFLTVDTLRSERWTLYLDPALGH